MIDNHLLGHDVMKLDVYCMTKLKFIFIVIRYLHVTQRKES